MKNRIRSKLFTGQHLNFANFPLIQVNGFRMPQKIPYLHLFQIFWNKLVVLFSFSVHTDVSISCFFFSLHLHKQIYAQYFPFFVSSFLPWAV